MSANRNDISFNLTVDDKGFRDGMRKAEDAVDDLDKKSTTFVKDTKSKTDKATKSVKGASDKFAVLGRSAGLKFAGMIGVVFAAANLGKKLVRLFMKSWDDAWDSRGFQKKLELSLQSIGRIDVAPQMTAIADKIRDSFVIDGNDVKKGITDMLRSGLSPEQTKALAFLTADIAKVTQQSFASVATDVIGATMGDTGRLKRKYGVNVVPTGNKANDAASAISALSASYGGQGLQMAEAESPGAKLAIELSKMREMIGEALIPAIKPIIDWCSSQVNSGTVDGGLINQAARLFAKATDLFVLSLKAVVNGRIFEVIWELFKLTLNELVVMAKFAFIDLALFIGTAAKSLLLRLISGILRVIREIAISFMPDFLLPDWWKNLTQGSIDFINDLDEKTGGGGWDTFKDNFSHFGEHFLANIDIANENLKALTDTTEENTIRTQELAKAEKGLNKQRLDGTKFVNNQTKQAERLKLQQKQMAEQQKLLNKKSKGGSGYLTKSKANPYADYYQQGTPYDSAIQASQWNLNQLFDHNLQKRMHGVTPLKPEEMMYWGGDLKQMRSDHFMAVADAGQRLNAAKQGRANTIKMRIYSDAKVHPSMARQSLR